MAILDVSKLYELPVREECTGWRDLRLSERHRHWGWNCPAVDVDFLFLEYDKGQPVALVEYKHENAPPQRASHPNYQAIINLGNRAELPVFAVRYADDFSWWRIIPLNDHAKKWLPERQEMGEHEWVSLLYHIRGYELPDSVFADQEVEV